MSFIFRLLRADVWLMVSDQPFLTVYKNLKSIYIYPKTHLRKMAMNMDIYTIGYEGINQKSFMAWLKLHKIDAIADIGQRPLSRKKGFSKNGLRESLSENDIEYLGYPSLGVPKEMRDELKINGNYSAFFKKYEESLTSKKQEINELYSIIKTGKRIALLCFEHDHNKCHRMVLAEKIKNLSANGFKVHHLDPF